MVGGFCGKSKDYKANDNYYTPQKEWAAVAPYLPKDKLIWEAFYGDGKSGNYLKELGFNIIHEQEDFFATNKGDIVVSNPPYSCKKEVLQRLYSLQKPFVLLMPYEVLFYKYFEPFRNDCSLLIPSKRVNFLKDGKEVKFNYQTVWFCWKMNVPKLVFLDN